VFDVPEGVIRPRRSSAINGLDDTGEMILRRVQLCRTAVPRAFINDQADQRADLEKRSAPALVEIHGQHDERALVDCLDPTVSLLDAFARP